MGHHLLCKVMASLYQQNPPRPHSGWSYQPPCVASGKQAQLLAGHRFVYSSLNSCGRLHSSGLDVNSDVWTFVNWGCPFRLVSPLLDHTTPESTVIQMECGWAFSSALTKSGDVLVWFPFQRQMEEVIDAQHEAMDAQGNKVAPTPDNVIPCATWNLAQDPIRLPPLPPLPKLMEQDGQIKLVKIASFDCHLIGLTNQGHVVKFGTLENEVSTPRGRWQYVSHTFIVVMR